MREAPWRSALAMPEDATVEPPTIVKEAKIFAQPFQGVSPVPQTVRFGEESVAAEASPGGISSTAVRKRPNGFVQNENSPDRLCFRGAREIPCRPTERRLSTPFGSHGLNIRNQSQADGYASLINSPGVVRNPRDSTTRQENTHFEDFSRTKSCGSLASS
jgi:hypothetical protein